MRPTRGPNPLATTWARPYRFSVSGRAWWIGIALSTVVGACGGNGAATDDAPLTTEPSPVTAVAGDPAVATSAPPAVPIRIGPWDGRELDSICLESVETYTEWITVLEQDQAQPLEVVVAQGTTPVRDAIAAGFADGGVTVVTSGCDATLLIEIEGEVLSAGYTAGVLYAGADIQGRLTLTAEGEPTLTASLQARHDPPETYVLLEGESPPHDPEDAPILDTIEDDLCAVFESWIDGPFDFAPGLSAKCWRG